MGEELPTVVLDLGGETLRAGFAGESAPRHRCSGIIAEVRTTHGIRESYERSGRKVTYIGDEMYASDAPYSGYFFYNSIMESRLLSRYSQLDAAIQYLCYKTLLVAPEEQPLLLVHSAEESRDMQQYVTTAFESFNVPAYLSAPQEAMALLSNNKTTGLIVDFGRQVTAIAPILDGQILAGAKSNLLLGGLDVPDVLFELMTQGGKYASEFEPYGYRSKENLKAEIARKLAYCSNDVQREVANAVLYAQPPYPLVQFLNGPAFQQSHLGSLPRELLANVESRVFASSCCHKYQLPDVTLSDKVTPGPIISVGKEAFLCTEIYFNPRDRLIDNQLSRRRQCEYPARSTKNDIQLAPGEDVGVPQRIINAIQKLPAELRATMYKNIYLSGGGSKLPHIDKRIKQELSLCLPKEEADAVNITVTPHGADGAWIGASMLASSERFSSLCVTREEYEEHGPSIATRIYKGFFKGEE